jgi:hypothetical protein
MVGVIECSGVLVFVDVIITDTGSVAGADEVRTDKSLFKGSRK